MNSELINVIDQIGREKGIDKNVLINVVKTAVLSASRKKLHLTDCNIQTEFNEETGDIDVFILKKVVKKIQDITKEIVLKDAIKLDHNVKLDEYVKIPHEAAGFGRISAQLAKQVIIQKVREAERESIFNDYKNQKGQLIHGNVSRFEKNDIIVDLGKTEGLLSRREQVYREKFKRGDRIRTYLLDVKRASKRPQVILSRTHPNLLIGLLELEVPEISEGIIEIKNAVREPYGRSKIAVYSREKDVDAVGACVGIRGIRVQAVVQELKGEKIDIVEWSEDPVQYVTNALKPAKISKVNLNKTERSLEVVVPKDQLSLAIGKNGQNVRLAARLTGWKIDIINEEELKREAEFKLKKQEEENNIKSADVSEIDGIGKISSLLYEHNIKTLGDLLLIEKESLLAIPSIGAKRAEKIVKAAESFFKEKKEELFKQEDVDTGDEHDKE